MTNTENIIWRRIQEKAERMAMEEYLSGEKELSKRETECWDAHCYKYIDTSGKANYILSQEEFDKIKFLVSLREIAYEILYCQNRKLPDDVKGLLNYIFSSSKPDFKILRNLMIIRPMWDDREKKLRD